MQIIETFTAPGKDNWPNEDRFGHVGRSAWVIDGATGLGDRQLIAGEGESDAAWMAEKINRSLTAHAEEFGADLQGLLQAVRADTTQAFKAGVADAEKIESWAYPCAAIQIMHAGEQGAVSMASLGDSTILRRSGTFVQGWYGHEDHSYSDDIIMQKLSAMRAAEPEITHAELGERIMPFLREGRAKTNSEGSYTVLCMKNDFTGFLACDSVTAQAGDQFLLMTDGFYALTDKYGAYDDAGLFEAITKRGMTELYAELRGIENTDPEGRAYPRFKKSDDATAVLLTL